MVRLNKKGETLLETLCAMIILLFVVSAFATVIRKTTEFNKQVNEERVSFNISNRQKLTTQYVIRIEYGTADRLGEFERKTATSNGVQWYSDGELYYYEYDEDAN